MYHMETLPCSVRRVPYLMSLLPSIWRRLRYQGNNMFSVTFAMSRHTCTMNGYTFIMNRDTFSHEVNFIIIKENFTMFRGNVYGYIYTIYGDFYSVLLGVSWNAMEVVSSEAFTIPIKIFTMSMKYFYYVQNLLVIYRHAKIDGTGLLKIVQLFGQEC
jgi:hypothetical protein